MPAIPPDAPEPDAPFPDYSDLKRVLHLAFLQASEGKGSARHGNGLPFPEQPILTLTRLVGPGFPLGQAMKKAQETIGMAQRGETSAAKAELLGAIVYLAAAHIFLEE